MIILNKKNIARIKQLAESYGGKRLILFGSALDNPSEAGDVDLACDGISVWKLYEFAAKLEDGLRIAFDVAPLSPPNRFTRYISFLDYMTISIKQEVGYADRIYAEGN